ncbi:MAG: hypothetical protein RBT11_14180 [Desulfobacterales bacterium]|jgi:hypothetical protein|nr:hypothetical protein [Desulfobacterales bacterium]
MYYSEMVDYVQPGISAPAFVVEAKIQDAVIQFCEETGLWVVDLPAIDTVIDEGTYDISSTDGIINSVLSVKDENEYELAFIVAEDFSSITLNSIPSSVFEITPKVVLIPEIDGGEFPDFIYLRHREAIIAGARYKLFEMPNRSWSNDNEAAKALIKFRNGIARANQSTLLGRKKESFVRIVPFV